MGTDYEDICIHGCPPENPYGDALNDQGDKMACLVFVVSFLPQPPCLLGGPMNQRAIKTGVGARIGSTLRPALAKAHQANYH